MTKILCIGEILWDVFPTGRKVGGAPFNVAMQLNNLDCNVVFAGKVGQDKLGEGLLQFMSEAKLSTDLMQVDKVLPTSEVLVNIENKESAAYEIIEPVAWDNFTFNTELEEIAKSSDIVIFGTLFSRNETSKKALKQVLSESALKVLDVNLRPPFDKKATVLELLQLADVVKVNMEELEKISIWNAWEQLSFEEQLQKIIEAFSLQMICVTNGKNGAHIYNDGKIYNHPGYSIQVVDSVGAGDAFLAGLIFALSKNKNIEDILNFASALGAYVASKNGATPKIDIQWIERTIDLA